MNTTPVSLLKRLQRPDAQAAWSQFVKLYLPLVKNWVRRLGVNDDDADDLIQDTFTVLLQKLPKFQYDPAKQFRGWLWTVILNQFRERRRRERNREHPLAGAGWENVPDCDEATPPEEAEYRWYIVQRALQLMQTDFQPSSWKAFWGLVVDDRTGAEVAAELGMKIDAVYAAKSRVLRRLRQELDGLLECTE